MSKKASTDQMHLNFLLTEYTNLQSARGIVNAEISSRVNNYFTVFSSVVIAYAFLSQLSLSSLAYQVFVWLAFPALLVIGVLTLGKIIELGSTDIAYLKAINRIRNFYANQHPEIKDLLLFPPHDDANSVSKLAGYYVNLRGNLLSSGAPVIFINSIVLTIFSGLALSAFIDIKTVHFIFLLIIAFLSHSFFAATFARLSSYPEYTETKFPAPKS
jgi:hypothetical protein